MSGLSGGSSSPSVDSLWQTQAANNITAADIATFAPQQLQQGTNLLQGGQSTYNAGTALVDQGNQIYQQGVAGADATTGAGAPYFQQGQSLVAQGNSLLQPLETGTLLPGEQALLDTTLQAENAQTQGTFANLNLAGSTMDTSALNLNQQQSTALQFQIAQQLASTGLNIIGAGATQEGVGATEQGIQESLANLGIAGESAGAQQQQVGEGEQQIGQASQNTGLQTYQNALQAYLAEEGLQLNTDAAYNTASAQLGGAVGSAAANLVGGSLGSTALNSLLGTGTSTAAGAATAATDGVTALSSGDIAVDTGATLDAGASAATSTDILGSLGLAALF